MTQPSQQQQPVPQPPAPAPPNGQQPQVVQPGQQGDQSQQQQHGQQGQFPQQLPVGQPQPAPNPWVGLLDVAPPQGQQQAAQQFPFPVFPQPGQQFQQQPAPQGIDPGQLADVIGRAVTSAVDRRVNQLTNPQWQQAHGQQPAPQQGQPPQQYPQQYQAPPPPAGPSDADQREARMAGREYLGDRLQFGNDAERAMAVDLLTALIPGQLGMGMTPNQAAQAAAQAVADRVTSLRRTYEDQAVRALRARGLLIEPQQAPAGMAGSVGLPQGGQPVSATNQQQAQAKLQRNLAWAAEENAQRGWKTKPDGAAVSG